MCLENKESSGYGSPCKDSPDYAGVINEMTAVASEILSLASDQDCQDLLASAVEPIWRTEEEHPSQEREGNFDLL